jgi:dTMP kinase
VTTGKGEGVQDHGAGTLGAMRGRYIALEGPEGCGKSSVATALAGALDAVLTRETGGTPIGGRIRAILHDPEVTAMNDRAEALLTAADRAQHLAEVVAPALRAGRHVVSDRSVYSTLAYQGYGRGLLVSKLREINDWAVGSVWPDLAVLLDAPAEILEARMSGRQYDRFELQSAAFHRRVRDGFRRLAEDEPDRWIVVDATSPADEVAATVRAAVTTRLGI